MACPAARDIVRAVVDGRPDVTLVEYEVATALEQARAYGLVATPALVIDRDTVLYGIPARAALAARLDERCSGG